MTVIVPLYNEEIRLAQNLRSVLSQQNAPTFEVIYIDDGSTDRSWSKLAQLSTDLNNVRLYRTEKKYNVGTVRRLGVLLAKGRIIANMDADCVVPADWLANWVHLKDDVGVVGFPVFPPSNLEYLHWRCRYTGTGQYAPGSKPHGCGALIRRDLLLEAGNFAHAKRGEDTRLFQAIEDMGVKILLMDQPTICLLSKRTTLKGHLGRYYAMGQDHGPRTRLVYLALLANEFALALVAVVAWPTSPVVSLACGALGLGVLANPKRIREYVRSFELPKGIVAKTAYFGAIKVLETLSIIAGCFASLFKKEEAYGDVLPGLLPE